MFYNIPTIQNMIAARQLGFLGKVVPGPHNAPTCPMLTVCCQHNRKPGCPYIHNKDIIIRNLCLLFARTPEVVIDDYGSVKDWFHEVSHELYWTQLVRCLLDEQTPLPACPLHGPRHDGTAPEPTCQLHLPMPLMNLEATTMTATLICHLFPISHINDCPLPPLVPATTNEDQTRILTWSDAASSTHSKHWDFD
jgi:hypothetical protein